MTIMSQMNSWGELLSSTLRISLLDDDCSHVAPLLLVMQTIQGTIYRIAMDFVVKNNHRPIIMENNLRKITIGFCNFCFESPH